MDYLLPRYISIKTKKYRYSAALLQLLIICEIKVCLKLLQTF